MLIGKLVSTIGSEHNEKAMRSNQVMAMANRLLKINLRAKIQILLFLRRE